MLRASAALLIVLSACTTEPETSPGELTRVRDQQFDCNDTAADASWACSVDLQITGDQLTSVGIHNDGSETGPRAVAVLSPVAVAEVNAMISSMPTSQEDEGLRCGGAPLAIRNYTIDFETVGVTTLEFHSVEAGPAHDLENYISGLITAIDSCQGNDKISFTSCTPRIAPRQ